MACLGAGAILVGLILLLVGRRGYCVGADPHCRACGYNCTGLSSPRCPECGQELNARTIITGARHRRRGMMIAGGALMGGALALIAIDGYRWCTRQNWWEYAPLSWVAKGVQNNSTAAVKELRVRYLLSWLTQETELSPRTRDDVVEALLIIQRNGVGGTWISDSRLPSQSGRQRGNVLSLLHTYYLDGLMTEDQRDTYLRQVATSRYAIRDTVRAEDPWPIEFVHDQYLYYQATPLRSETPELHAAFTHVTVTTAGRVLFDRSFSPPSYWGKHLIDINGLEPGTHKITTRLSNAVYDRQIRCCCPATDEDAESDEPIPEPVWTGVDTFEHTLTIVAKNKADPLAVSRDDAFTRQLEQALTQCEVWLTSENGVEAPNPSASPVSVHVRVRFKFTTAVNDAYLEQLRLRLQFDTWELALRRSQWGRSSHLGEVSYYFDFRKTVATEQPLVGQGITVVLFNDLEEARQSTMYYEVWGGQVRIGPVIIAGERPQSSDWEEPQTPPPPIINAVGVNP